MKNFGHINARSLDEAVTALQRYGKRAAIIAGGTDILGKMKDEILPTYPEALVNIKTIAGLGGIVMKNDVLSIGALTRLEDIATNEKILDGYPALAEAARRTASAHLREMGTIGGNICQDIRCWYYRNQNNRFPCLRKGGGKCYAIDGDNRYHSIFGGSVEEGCYAVHPSDTVPALIALDASVKTSRRTIKAEKFFQVSVSKTTVLEDDEIVTEIVIPRASGKSAFVKFALRKTIDFPIVNCAAMVTFSGNKAVNARICLNAVSVIPRRVVEAEEFIKGKVIEEATADAAGVAAVSSARPMSCNGYMVQIAKTMVKRAILKCAQVA